MEPGLLWTVVSASDWPVPLQDPCLAFLNVYIEYFIYLILIQEGFLQDGWKQNASANEGSGNSCYEEHHQEGR